MVHANLQMNGAHEHQEQMFTSMASIHGSICLHRGVVCLHGTNGTTKLTVWIVMVVWHVLA